MIRFVVFVYILFLTACSLYQSPGREAIEKGAIELTKSGANLDPAVKYQCYALMALPANWQQDVMNLDEYSSLPGTKAVLLSESEVPTVVIYAWLDRHVEGCELAILDSKVTSHNLSEVVALGEKLLSQAARR